MEDIKDVILIEIWKYDYLVDLVFHGNHDSNNLLGSWFLVFIVFFFKLKKKNCLRLFLNVEVEVKNKYCNKKFVVEFILRVELNSNSNVLC